MGEIAFLRRADGALLDPEGFGEYARGLSHDPEQIRRLCGEIQKASVYDRVLEAEKFLALLDAPALPSGETLLRTAGYKLQGTDGIRGRVGAPAGGGSSRALFAREGVLSAPFCRVYGAAFFRLLREEGISAEACVLGEDGRDFHTGGALKEALLQGMADQGVRCIDLGQVPTPYLAAYSQREGLPGVMLTASHNPWEYNGVKLFLRGRKLLPEGPLGEYRFSHRVLTAPEALPEPAAFGRLRREEREILPEIFADLSERTRQAAAGLPSLHLVLDGANGVYSVPARRWLKEQGHRVDAAACRPGPRVINRGCGVAELEGCPEEISPGEEAPATVRRLFRAGREAPDAYSYAVVLDGDGDRGFLLLYEKAEERVFLYDGDLLGYLIAREGSALRGGTLICTVESDTGLSAAAEELPGFDTALCCVGDRWLFAGWEGRDGSIGVERSGHVILPRKLSADPAAEPHLSGNGLLTAYLGLCALEKRRARGLPLRPGRIYPRGFRREEPFREGALELFYRGSPLWDRAAEILRGALPWECREKVFEEERDMLFFEVIDQKKAVGRWYIRKSGTERKLTVTASVRPSCEGLCRKAMARVREELGPCLNPEG